MHKYIHSPIDTLPILVQYSADTNIIPSLYSPDTDATTRMILMRYWFYTRVLLRQVPREICCLCVVQLQPQCNSNELAHTLSAFASSLHSIAMAASLSPSALSSPSLQRVSAGTSASYGAQTRIGVTGRRRSNCSVGARAQQQEGGGRERDEVSELEKALGIENKTVRNVSADKKGPQRRRLSMLDALEEQMRVNDGNQPPENKFIQTVRSIGDWLIDKTENSDGQDNVVRFAFIIFPIWFLALLVTSGVVTVPFDLPFLRNLSQHLAETQ